MRVCPWRGPYRVILYDHELTCKVVIGFQGISYACRSLVRTISLQYLCESFQKWKLYYLVMNTRREIHHTLVPWLLWLARPIPWSYGEYTNLFIKKNMYSFQVTRSNGNFHVCSLVGNEQLSS